MSLTDEQLDEMESAVIASHAHGTRITSTHERGFAVECAAGTVEAEIAMALHARADVLALVAEVRELRTGIVAAIASCDAHEEHYAQGAAEALVLDLLRETVKP